MAPDNVVHSPMAAAAEAALDSLEADSPSNNTPGFATPGAVESYLKLMREAGISDPTRATKEGDHAPSPTSFKTAAPADPVPVAGYYGRPGEQLGTAEEARKIYEEQGWLPAVTGPYEEDRRRVLERYSLPHATKNEQIDRIADTAQCVFSVPIVVVSLVLEDRETFVCTLGWDAVSFD